jgi:hypothetical protein
MNWRRRYTGLNDEEFRRRYRLTKTEFDDLAKRLVPYLKGKTKRALSVELQLSITLRLLAGGSYLDVADLHGVALCTANKAYNSVLDAIDAEVQLPLSTEEDLQDPVLLEELAAGFARHTDGVVYGAIGALDGVHVKIERPEEDGDTYMCRKGFFSINAQCIVDAYRRFLFVDCNARGPTADCTAFLGTELCMALDEKLLPEAYWFYGDDAYKAVRTMIPEPISLYIVHLNALAIL